MIIVGAAENLIASSTAIKLVGIVPAVDQIVSISTLERVSGAAAADIVIA